MGSRRGSPANGRPTSGRLGTWVSEAAGWAKTRLIARASAIALADVSSPAVRASRGTVVGDVGFPSQAATRVRWARAFRIDMSGNRRAPLGQPAELVRYHAKDCSA